LTEEEKKAKLAELRQKLAEKRAGQAKEDVQANKANEVSRGTVCVWWLSEGKVDGLHTK
jgi:hypothetical protein